VAERQSQVAERLMAWFNRRRKRRLQMTSSPSRVFTVGDCRLGKNGSSVRARLSTGGPAQIGFRSAEFSPPRCARDHRASRPLPTGGLSISAPTGDTCESGAAGEDASDWPAATVHQREAAQNEISCFFAR
jgi:hypothetical protein